MDTTTIAPLTRREAREIERRTGRRPVAGAVAPTELTLTTALDVAHTDVEDTSRIERNEMAALVSVVPTEIIERIAAPAPVESLIDDETDIPDTFRGRPVSVRAAKPASLVARQRRRRATGLAIAASAAALATAGAIIPASLGGASNDSANASLLSQVNTAAEQSTAVDDAAPDAAAPVADLVPAPEQADGTDPFSVTTFSADEVSEAAETSSTTDGGVSTGGSTDSDTQGAGGGGYGDGYGQGVMATADSMVGTGAGWTCDRFVREVFAANGISLGVGVSGIASQAYPISASEARPGDLLVWPGEHIGIYAGGDMMYDNPGDGRASVYRAIWGNPVFYRL